MGRSIWSASATARMLCSLRLAGCCGLIFVFPVGEVRKARVGLDSVLGASPVVVYSGDVDADFSCIVLPR